MRLGIDLDGVVADFNTGWMTRYNAAFGTSLTPDMVTMWDAMVALGHFETDEEFWEWVRAGDGPGLFRSLPLYDDALRSLEDLARNHDIVVITTKPEWAASETFAWLAEHAIPTREVHITDQKWRVDCDVYLDDGPHNLEALALERPDRTICRFVRPWNGPIPGVIDIPDWDTFVTLVDNRYC